MRAGEQAWRRLSAEARADRASEGGLPSLTVLSLARARLADLRICSSMAPLRTQFLRTRYALRDALSPESKERGRQSDCSGNSMSRANRFVYVLRNDASPPSYYTGLTCDVSQRL